MSNWTTPEEEASTGKVIAAALAVHRSLGPGYLESIYHRALTIELGLRGITPACEVEVEITYAGVSVGRHRLDVIADRGILVELKAVQSLDPVHFAQVRSYLRATRLSVGLLLNFASPRLVIKRVVVRHRPVLTSSGLPYPPAFPRFMGHRAESDPSHARRG
jgi:GxxExxY protein